MLERYLRLEVVLGVPFEDKVAASEDVAQNTARMTRIEQLFYRGSRFALFAGCKRIARDCRLRVFAEVEDLLRAKRLRKGRGHKRQASGQTSRPADGGDRLGKDIM